jgi:Linalool dehydratase/isomerase
MAESKWSRRTFVRQVGAIAGAIGLPTVDPGDALAQAAPQAPALPEPPRSVLPALNRRTLGWLRFLWEKSTTKDDWGSNGVPHPWWDRYTNPVVLSYGRFDLSFSAYSLLLMADQTPAWREVYARIADELASRFPTYWGAIDWLTQIGDDPKRERYPAAVMNGIPERLRGKYNRFGWTANGVAPWGLQKDPIGADGYLFFRGWFGLLLSTYKYVSGDDKWARPFTVTGYGDEEFAWDHHRLSARLEAQYRQRPEGPQCENTKIWFFCNSAAGLGLYLYDKVYGRQSHRAVENFLEYARKNYMGISSDGKLEWITSYYDPVENFKVNGGAASGLNTAFMVLPQNRELATIIYEAAANAAGWRNPNAQIRANTNGLLLARELGDTAVADRLRAAAERENEPRFFGPFNEKFGWWFNLNEGFPRGQQNATMMVSEVGPGGAWMRAFEAPHLDKFGAPTLEGVEFPALGVYQAWNDPSNGTLSIGTYAASPDRTGTPTSWRVTNVPNPTQATITCDGAPFTRFEATGPNTLRVDTTVDTHQFTIVTGYRGPGTRAEVAPPPKAHASLAAAIPVRAATSESLPSGRAGCPCCEA